MYTNPLIDGVHPRARLVLLIAIAATIIVTLALPSTASAIAIIAPVDTQQLKYLDVRPVFEVRPATGEKPKWILIGTAPEMKQEQTIRYCRQWFAKTHAGQTGYNWACNAHSIGTDRWGNDITKNLEWGKKYYWKVIFTGADGKDRSSNTRWFRISDKPVLESPGSITNKIEGVANGTIVNVGAAEFKNSGLKVTSIRSVRVSGSRFRIEVRYQGNLRIRQSVISVKGPRGTKNVKLRGFGRNRLKGTIYSPVSERRTTNATYRYQAWLKSSKNGSWVRSVPKVMIVRTKRRSTPTWQRTFRRTFF